MSKSFRTRRLLPLLLLWWALLGAVGARAQVTLSFNNAEIESVARTVATLTKRNVVVDPRVKGQMSLNTDKPVSAAGAFDQFLAALRLQGFTVVEASGIYKVVPEADAKLQGGQNAVVAPGEKALTAGNQIVTQIFKLNFENANNLVPVLRPLIAPNNTINVNPGSNSLIITDYAENLARLSRIIAAQDVPQSTDVEVIPLKHALANDLAVLAARLLEGGGGTAPGGAPADAGARVSVIAEPRSNALIIRAGNEARLALARSLVAQLDQPSKNDNGAAGNIYVVYLKNAEATKLAVTLRAAMSVNVTGAGSAAGMGSGGATMQQPSNLLGAGGSLASAPIAPSAMPSTGGQIQADPATNSLIITASEPQYRQLRAVIDKLDTRRAQVFVESLIAEVNEDKMAAFGVQWQSALGQNGQTNIGLLGTNFAGAGNILSAAQAGATGKVDLGTGLNVGVAHQTNGRYVLGFLGRFIETNSAGNVLSTPNLLTLDNEEAKIVIGQNVPFVTGQFTNAAAGGATNPFQTIERKDVGLTLRVKPQISENGTVKMTIYQEVSNVQASSVSSAQGPITNKRSIESNVLVQDGSVVVLGGLLQDASSANQDKVPGLGNIPILGALFRSESKQRNKTNLMVFLRPVVVRDADSTEALSLSRYDYMRGTQQAINTQSLSAPENKDVPQPKEDVGRFGGALMPEALSKLKSESSLKVKP